MKYTTITNADIEVSKIALGCWQFAGGAMWGEQDDRSSIDAVHAALDNGINLFDTAEAYGNGKSEEVLGEALRGKRSNAVIATKASGPTFERDELTGACEKSLRRLKTDYIDIYQLHWPRDGMVESRQFLETAEELKRAGKIRHFGVCNFGPKNLNELLENGMIATNQLSYSLLWRGLETEILPILEANSIGILTYSSLVHGLLSGKYRNLDEFPDGRARSLHFSGEREGVRHGQSGEEELTSRTIEAIRSLCTDAGISMTAASFGWAAEQPMVSSVLAGARSVEQVEANAAIAEIEFPSGFFDSLTEASEELKEAFGSQVDMWQKTGRIK